MVLTPQEQQDLSVFYAWEYSIIGLVMGLVYYHPVLLAAVLAHLGHVATDHFHNGISTWGYSITYRAFDRALVSI